jgi:hypothetical protein
MHCLYQHSRFSYRFLFVMQQNGEDVEHFLSVGVLGQNSEKGGGEGGGKTTGVTAAAEVRRSARSGSKHTSKIQPTVWTVRTLGRKGQ